MLMMKQKMLLLKKEMRLVSLWFIMFFLCKKCNWKSLMLMYVITLGCLFFFRCQTRNGLDNGLRGFLNKYNVDVFVVF